MARPDLALVAMRQILGRVEAELLQEAAQQEQQRIRREDRLAHIRARHDARHEAQRKIGVLPPNHSLGSLLEQRRMQQETAVGVPSSSECCNANRREVDEQGAASSDMETAHHLQRPERHAKLTIAASASENDLQTTSGSWSPSLTDTLSPPAQRS